MKNKFLLVKDSVVLTEHITPVIERLDPFFEAHKLTAWVTSALRRPEDQLRIIRNELNRRGLSGEYQGAFEDIGVKVDDTYAWQLGWSKLLSLGFVVNPPYPAVALMDYYRPGSDKNKKGTLIGDSTHTRGGTAFDIGGGKDGVFNEAQVLERAMGNVKGLKGYLVERNNNACHVDCQPIDMTNFK